MLPAGTATSENAMTEHIGIIGCSAPGAAICFEAICSTAPEYLGRHAHPEVSMNVLSFAEHVRWVEAEDWVGLGDMLRRSSERLSKCGASFLICPDNTAHIAYAEAVKGCALPWLHIADAVSEQASARGYRQVGLLGTRQLLESQVYDGRFAREPLTPAPAERDALNEVIFDELVAGKVSPAGLTLFTRLCERMRGAGCDGIVLGCTELPLLAAAVGSRFGDIFIDSGRALARAAVRRAVGAG
jgi:aspartate racemase